MPAYVKVNGVLKKVSKIYDKTGGVLKEVKKGYDRVSGTLRLYHQSTIPLSEVPLGKTVVYGGKNYRKVADNYSVSGSAILWCLTPYKTGTLSSSRTESATSETPFGASNSYQVTSTYKTTRTGTATFTGYGWWLTAKQLGSQNTDITNYINDAAMPYFGTETNSVNRRYPNYESVWVPDITKSTSGITSYYYIYCPLNQPTVGSVLASSCANNDSSPGQYNRPFAYAYCVKGTLQCEENSDGTYTLQI